MFNGIASSVEPGKDFVLLRLWDADTVVFDADEMMAIDTLVVDDNRRARFGIFDGVTDEVIEDSLHALAIAVDDDLFRPRPIRSVGQ